MAGILDSKTRIIDTLITVTGRDQAARGELDVKFASITDRQLFYSTGSNGVLDDLTSRVYFESYSDDNDVVVYELDSKGSMQPFVSDDYTIYGGLAFDLTASQNTTTVGGSHGAVTFSPGSINLVSDSIIESSTKSFQRLMIIGSRNLSKYSKETPFRVSSNKLEFEITSESPIDINTGNCSVSTDQIESVFQDKKFANFLNYRYLPPITKGYTGNLNGVILANYSKINQDPITTYDELEEYLEGKPFQEIEFTETTNSNNIMAQIFSIDTTTNSLEKLGIVDVGEYQVDGSFNPHLFFAGKLFRDSTGALTFVNIFTIVLE